MDTLKELLKRCALPGDISRRGFLKVASSAAVIAAMTDAAAYTGSRPYIIMELPGGLILGDPQLCVNCQRCELACTEFNEGRADMRLSRIKIGRNIWFGSVGSSEIPPKDGIWGNGMVKQDTCRQCAHPVPCANACPRGAIRVDEKTRARVVNDELCIGCGLCIEACPWDMMSFDYEKNKASKCNLCNGSPKCVKACPAAALVYLPWKNRSGEPSRRAPNAYLPEENRKQCGACHG